MIINLLHYNIKTKEQKNIFLFMEFTHSLHPISVHSFFKLKKTNNMKKQSLYSEKLEKGNRRFYFDIRETEKGSNYFTINEITTKENEDDKRRQIMVFENEVDRFAAAIVRTLLHFNVKDSKVPQAKVARIQEAKAKYARAYEPWTKKEDAELALLYSQGKSKTEIGTSLQRNPGAINVRIEKLNLVKPVAA